MGSGATTAWAVAVPVGYRVGPWEVTEGIATGSWGSVYVARSVQSREQGEEVPDTVALKFLPTGTLTPRQVRHLAETVERELRARALPPHHGLVRTFDVLTVDDPAAGELDGCVVLVMERAVGALAMELERHPGQPIPDAPRLISEIADALAHMHEVGWVHGDLKPSNVLVMDDGSIRLTDFGLAAEIEGTHGYQPPMGCADYLPPEAATAPLSERGRPTRTTADTWALGVTAHQLLTGHLPFPGSTLRARAAAAAEYVAGRAELVSLTGLPPGWREWVSDCLARDHQTRARHDLASLATRAAALSGTAPRRPPRKPRRWAVLGAAALVVTGATTAWATLFFPEGPPSRLVAVNKPLRDGIGIPPQYQQLIIQAGRSCREPALSPALVAAVLKVESNFDANLSDPAKDEYGIARWTPRVLRYHLPPGKWADKTPTPPFPPEMSIPAVGRFMCRYLPELAAVPGDKGLLIAAGYQFNTNRVLVSQGVPPEARAFVAAVEYYRALYDPARPRPTTSAP